MSAETRFTAGVEWQRAEQDFLRGKYSRRHVLRFDGGLEVPASSSPHVVPPPWSDAAAVDPEELFVASVANCHMLWFLSIAAKHGFQVDAYTDQASGVMQPNANGKLFVSVVTLRPQAVFSGGKLPTRDDLDHLHHEAHEECFIANSVRSDVRCEPVWMEPAPL